MVVEPPITRRLSLDPPKEVRIIDYRNSQVNSVEVFTLQLYFMYQRSNVKKSTLLNDPTINFFVSGIKMYVSHQIGPYALAG